MAANPHRGDVPVTIAGKDYVLRPVFEAMVEIEAALGTNLRPLAGRFTINGDYGARDIAAILLAGANAALRPGEKLKPADVQQAVSEEGIHGFAEQCGRFLLNCLTGGAKREETEPGEAKAAEGI